MKKIITLVTLAFIAIGAKASTSISVPVVSGHWTVSGSPYLVFNNIQIPSCDSLVIDPGVEIIFQGYYSVQVSGVLRALGSSSQHITFHVNDTLGWSHITDTLGAWKGISWDAYSCSGIDRSVLKYCDVTDMKYSSLFSGYRSDILEYCDLSHNIGGYAFAQVPSSSFELSHCAIHDNNSAADTGTYYVSYLVQLGSFYSTPTTVNVHDCSIYNNVGTSSILNVANCNFAFNSNTLYGNVVTDSVTADGTMRIWLSTAEIRGNKIYNNVDAIDAPINSYKNQIVIEQNLICNNRSLNGMATGFMCGATEGGGGIRIGGEVDSTQYFAIIRNNVIANNYAGFGGGGIYTINANFEIVNNTIVNNAGFRGGGITFNNYPDTRRNLGVIKNNLFYNNVTINNADTGTGPYLVYVDTTDVFTEFADSVLFEHNWIRSAVHNMLQLSATYADMSSVFTLKGDTTTNIIGNNPYLIAPTHAASYTESALAANFGIGAYSGCIDNGSVTGVAPGSADYINNVRVFGTAVDIGAYEYGAPPYSGGTLNIAPTASVKTLSVYPNPAANTVFIVAPEANGEIVMSDVMGKTITRKIATNSITSLDLQSVPRGLYFVTWSNGSDSKIVEKVIVQ